MVSSVLLNIRRLVSDIEAQIAECEREIADRQGVLQRLRAARSSLLDQAPSTVPVEEEDEEDVEVDEEWLSIASEPRTRRRRERKGSEAHIIREFARQALRGAGKPLQRGEILELLRREGITIGAKAPERRIGKVLWQSDEFENIGNGYWFKGELPPDKV